MIRILPGISIAVVLGAAWLPALAHESSLDGFSPPQNLNYYDVPGPDLASDDSAAPNGASGTFLFIAGSAFTPLGSTQTVEYSGSGCSTSNGTMTTSVMLPDGAEVLGFRMYYYNDGTPSNFATVRFQSYTGLGGQATLITGLAGGNTDYESQYFQSTSTLVIDGFNYSYALTASAPSGMRICGVRVQYSP